MQAWFESDLGQYVLSQELAWFDAECSDIFGFNAMQVSTCGVDYLRANRMPNRFCCGVGEGTVFCRPEELPIASQSLDLLILPHVLEFSPHPHQVLREAERVLRPEGRILIAGFNPWSLWGLRRLVNRDPGGWPWQGDFIQLTRLKDWMALLGFDLVAGRMGCYVPPLNQVKWIERMACLEAAGDRWWALGGGIYLLHGVKRVHGMRLIAPKWEGKWMTRPAWAPAPRKSAHTINGHE